MNRFKFKLFWFVGFLCMSLISAGISPIHDFFGAANSRFSGDKLAAAPYKITKNLDNSLFKLSKNITENPQTEEKLNQISKDLVSAILSKLEIQDKITRITREALEAPGKSKGITAIETRRILDYISRTLSGQLLSITRASTEPELHRLVYGLAQISAEISIVAALKDITYATTLSKKQSVDLSLRKKRAAPSDHMHHTSEHPHYMSTGVPPVTTMLSILRKPSKTESPKKPSKTDFSKKSSKTDATKKPSQADSSKKASESPIDIDNVLTPYSLISRNERRSMQFLSGRQERESYPTKGFLNQTALDLEDAERNVKLNETDQILLDKPIKGTQYATVDTQTLDNQEPSVPGLVDDWIEPKTGFSADVAADIEIDQPGLPEDDVINEKKQKQKLEKLELKAKKAILYAGDVAYLTAASVVAMRRALTASIEVHMSVKYAKNGMSNHQDLMMNLAKTAAQQAGKEAKSATSKSLSTERVIKLALKYTAQSHGAKLNHVANRIVMETLSLSTLAKSMAFVSSDIAINSLYQATDVKPPSE